MDKNKILKMQELRNQGFSFGHIASIIGITKSQANYYCKIDLKDYEKKQNTQKKFEEYICNLVPQCDNINQVCRLLGHKGTNTYYKQIENVITKYHIDSNSIWLLNIYDTSILICVYSIILVYRLIYTSSCYIISS